MILFFRKSLFFGYLIKTLTKKNISWKIVDFKTGQVRVDLAKKKHNKCPTIQLDIPSQYKKYDYFIMATFIKIMAYILSQAYKKHILPWNWI